MLEAQAGRNAIAFNCRSVIGSAAKENTFLFGRVALSNFGHEFLRPVGLF